MNFSAKGRNFDEIVTIQSFQYEKKGMIIVMTEKLYYKDQYQKEFTAKVLFCNKEENKYAIILDKTCFYPEGGGQPADKGFLNDIEVMDVQEKDENIIHYTMVSIAPGTIVSGKINFEHRFSLMQEHSGEHILSGFAYSLFGCTNVGFHMSEEFITVDLDKPLTDENLIEIEEKTNDVIYNNLEIIVYYPTKEELFKIDYRSKKDLDGQVRLIKIEDVDICACCGLHTRYTGEIGVVKISTWQNYKGGVRLFLKIGKKAYLDYKEKNDDVYRISRMLSTKPEMITQSIEKVMENEDLIKQKLSNMQKRYFEKLVNDSNANILFEDNLSSDEIRNLCNELIKSGKKHAAVFSSDGNAGYRYALVSKDKEDIRPICKELNKQFNGSGGGKSDFCMGSIKKGIPNEISKIWSDFFLN